MTTAAASEDQRQGPIGVLRRTLDRPAFVVAAATVLVLATTAWGLTSRSIWLDEAFTVMHARLGAADFWELVFDREANAALHSTLIHAMGDLGGRAWALRLPSVVAVTLLVPVTYLFARRLFHPAVGAVAAVLVACNGFVVEYGQEGRGYALLMLVAAASAWLLVRALQEDDTFSWSAWVLVSCLLGYAHFFGALVLAAEAAALGVRWLARSTLVTRWRPILVGGAVIVVAHLPLAAFLAFGGSKGQNEGLPDFTPVRFVGIFVRLVGNFGVPLVVLVAIPCLLALHQVWQRRRVLDEQTWGIVLCTCGVAVPVLLAAAVSLVDPLFVARYFVEVIPFLAALTAFGLTRVRPPWLRVALAGGIVVLGLAGVASWHQQPSREDADGLVAILAGDDADGVQAGDAIVFDPWFARVPIELALEDEPDAQDLLEPAYPDAPWGDWLPTDDPGPIDRPVVTSLDAERIWVVQRRGPEGEEVPVEPALAEALVASGFDEVLAEELDGLTLRRYDRRP